MSSEMPVAKKPNGYTKRGVACMRKMAESCSRQSNVLEHRDLSDDGDMESFLKDGEDHWKLGCLIRETAPKKRYMSKKDFEAWRKSLYELDDDKPLKVVL